MQAREVERGCDIIIGTPGRLLDMIDRGKVSLSGIQFMIFDEADRMLDMGFEKQIRQIVEQHDLPSVRHRNTWMFSATFPKEIRHMASDFMRDYLFLKVGRVGSTTDSITQVLKWVDRYSQRDELLKDLRSNPGKTLVFVEKKREADSLARFLYDQGFGATAIHGDRSQAEREAALRSFRGGRITVLVATDVASRGLDIDNSTFPLLARISSSFFLILTVTHVIQVAMGSSIDDYIHRIGRTGRAGNTGVATSYFNEDNKALSKKLVKVLEEANQIVPPWLTKIAAEFRGKKAGRGYGRGGGGGNRGYGGGGGAPRGYGSHGSCMFFLSFLIYGFVLTYIRWRRL